MSKQEQIEKWLNEKVNDKTLDKYGINEYTIRPYSSKHELYCYYKQNDSDMRANNALVQNDESSRLREYNDHILLYPNTNRYHANSLFRQLIDHSYDNNFDYELYNDETSKYDRVNIMDVELKKSFYKFCYDNSS